MDEKGKKSEDTQGKGKYEMRKRTDKTAKQKERYENERKETKGKEMKLNRGMKVKMWI